ncbi:MAG: hypothetical protein ABH878_03095, partial [bacterium]
MRSTKTILPILLMLALLALWGCESDEGAGPAEPTDPLSWVNQGWVFYSGDNYNDAYDSFSQGVDLAED